MTTEIFVKFWGKCGNVTTSSLVSGLLAVSMVSSLTVANSSETADTEPPAVKIENMPEVVHGNFSISIVFTESVRGFSYNDISAVNAELRQFTGEKSHYHAKVIPNLKGTVKIVVSAHSAVDAAGNKGPTKDIWAIATLPDEKNKQERTGNNRQEGTGNSTEQFEKKNPIEEAIVKEQEELADSIIGEDSDESVQLNGEPLKAKLLVDPPRIDATDEEFSDIENF